jgi:hypothetical protein
MLSNGLAMRFFCLTFVQYIADFGICQHRQQKREMSRAFSAYGYRSTSLAFAVIVPGWLCPVVLLLLEATASY